MFTALGQQHRIHNVSETPWKCSMRSIFIPYSISGHTYVGPDALKHGDLE